MAAIWPSSSRIARALLPGETGRFVAMGPVTSARYAWVLLDRALVQADVAGFAARAAESEARGRIRGLGVASYLEATLGVLVAMVWRFSLSA